MKNRLLFLGLLLVVFFCKAQVIGTLEQFEECRNRPNYGDGCPDLENITYVKDTNNRLNQFVGTWKGNYGGKQYEMHFEKKNNYKHDPSGSVSWDTIFGRMIIKDNQGNMIYNSINQLDKDISFSGDNFQHRAYIMTFVGNYYCLESGNVFIETRLNNPNEMTLYYSQDKDGLLNPAKCPNFSSFVPLLPQEKMVLTKQ